MIGGIAGADLAWLVAGLAVAGALAGYMAGIFGIGGGAVIVPVVDKALALLDYDDSIRMHVALGTSLAVIVPTSLRSFRAHRARGAVDMTVLRNWVVAAPLGVLIASGVAAVASGGALRLAFAGVATLVALRLLFNRQSWRLGSALPVGPGNFVAGMVIGFLSTLMGVGGGVMSSTYLTLYGRPIHQAVATSAGVGVLIAIPGTIGYMLGGLGTAGLPPFSIGYVNLLGVALIIPLTLLFAPLGVRTAHALAARSLERVFAVFLLLVAARFAWDVL
jgi:uncharacterized membrane protein YfcA